MLKLIPACIPKGDAVVNLFRRIAGIQRSVPVKKITREKHR